MTTKLLTGFALAAIVVAAPAVPALAEGPRLLATTASGLVPREGESRVALKGFVGELSVHPGADGEFQFESVRKDDRRQELAIAVWADGGTLRFESPGDQSPTARVLDLVVPRGINVVVEASDSTVAVGEIDGQVEIDGDRVLVTIGALGGNALVTVRGGKLQAQAMARDLSVRGTDLDAEIGPIAGRVSLDLTRGSVSLKDLGGDVDGTTEYTDVALSGVHGPTTLRMKGGALRASGLEQGGELQLAGATAILTKCKGNLTLVTDAEVRFAESTMSLKVDGGGGAVRGSGNVGPVEVRTSDAEVIVEKVTGPVRVEGRGLTVKLTEISGDIAVHVANSAIEVTKAQANVELRNDGGDVTLDGASGDVTVVSADGNVHLANLNGSASVSADGDELEVSWLSLGSAKDSVIKNEGGGAVVRFLSSSACRVEATTRFGRIESALARVLVQEGGSQAAGIVGGGGRAAVKIDVRGDLRLFDTAP